MAAHFFTHTSDYTPYSLTTNQVVDALKTITVRSDMQLRMFESNAGGLLVVLRRMTSHGSDPIAQHHITPMAMQQARATGKATFIEDVVQFLRRWGADPVLTVTQPLTLTQAVAEPPDNYNDISINVNAKTAQALTALMSAQLKFDAFGQQMKKSTISFEQFQQSVDRALFEGDKERWDAEQPAPAPVSGHRRIIMED